MQIKPQPAPTILGQELVHTTLSIIHHSGLFMVGGELSSFWSCLLTLQLSVLSADWLFLD
jgi:hypothetical protein